MDGVGRDASEGARAAQASKPFKLWGAGTPRSLRPIWVAEELGLAYDLAPIGPRTGETQTPAYTQLTRKQKIPFLEDGDVKLSESIAICRYLTAAYPGPEIWRAETLRDRAREDEWLCYFYGELDETALYVMRRHLDLAEIYGEAENAVRAAKGYLAKHLGVIATHLENRARVMGAPGPQAPGDQLSLPDIVLVSCLDWAVVYGVAAPEPLLAYRRGLARRPAYRRAMRVNYRDLPGLEQLLGED
ncbi:MAG: glutathione S-transferase family protein [Pseudomonadota bacterium]